MASRGRAKSGARADASIHEELGDEDPASTGRGSAGADHASTLAPLALRAREAARMLGISERALWTLTSSREIPHVRVGKAVLYPVDELKAWLSERARGSTRKARSDSS